MKYNFIFIYFFIVAITGCHEKDNYVGKRIILPDDIPLIFRGDTIQKAESDFKIITTINGSCWTCLQDFIQWNKIIPEIKKINNKIELSFYVKAWNYESVKDILTLFKFDHPIYVDKKTDFIRNCLNFARYIFQDYF